MMKFRLITFLFAALLSCLFSVAQTKQPPINRVTEKFKHKNYVGLSVQTFYNDFKDLIKEPIWSDEPPGKLRGAYFALKNASSYFLEIYFKVNPKSVRFNENRRWTIKSIQKSKITYVALIKGDSTILKLTQ